MLEHAGELPEQAVHAIPDACAVDVHGAHARAGDTAHDQPIEGLRVRATFFQKGAKRGGEVLERKRQANLGTARYGVSRVVQAQGAGAPRSVVALAGPGSGMDLRAMERRIAELEGRRRTGNTYDDTPPLTAN